MKKILHYSRGFALIELIVAILIIGILASVVSLSIIKAQKAGRDTQRKSDLASIEKTLASYYAQNKMYPITSIQKCSITDPYCDSGDSNSWNTDMTTGMIPGTSTPIPAVWIRGSGTTVGLNGYTDKLPNDPIGNGEIASTGPPILWSEQDHHYYAYYSKACLDVITPDPNCPYSGRVSGFEASAFYILTATLENESDSEIIDNANPYFLNCEKMKGVRSSSATIYNQNLYMKIKTL